MGQQTNGTSGDVEHRVPAHSVDHLVVPVEDLDEAVVRYGDIFATDFYPLEDSLLAGWGSGRAALSVNGIELIERGTGDLAAWAGRCGEAVFAMALRVPDVDAAEASLRSAGLRPIGRMENDTIRAAAFHPDDAHGICLQVIEYLPSYRVGDLEAVSRWRQVKGLESVPTPFPDREGPAIRSLGVDHVICFVADLEAARQRFGSILQTQFSRPHGTSGTRISVDGLGIELLSADETADPFGVRVFQARRRSPDIGGLATGEGVGAVSVKVDAFDEAVERMAALGNEPVGTRELPTRRVALYANTTEPAMGIELIAYTHLAHPLVCRQMVSELRAAMPAR